MGVTKTAALCRSHLTTLGLSKDHFPNLALDRIGTWAPFAPIGHHIADAVLKPVETSCDPIAEEPIGHPVAPSILAVAIWCQGNWTLTSAVEVATSNDYMLRLTVGERALSGRGDAINDTPVAPARAIAREVTLEFGGRSLQGASVVSGEEDRPDTVDAARKRPFA